jgi:hypothetical protein
VSLFCGINKFIKVKKIMPSRLVIPTFSLKKKNFIELDKVADVFNEIETTKNTVANLDSDTNLNKSLTNTVGTPKTFSFQNLNRSQNIRQTENQEFLEVSFDNKEILDPNFFEKVNSVQVKYKSFSKLNPTGAVIPTAIAWSTYKALENLEKQVGNIDDYVCNKLQWTPKELSKYLTSEQTDAVALGVNASEMSQGLILADSTGFGKGRILATISLARILQGKRVIFLTEKANLFSDFYRDIKDIGSEKIFGTPFMLNDKAKILDTASLNAEVLFNSLKKVQIEKILKLEEPEWLNNQNFIMATYSQFNRKGTKKSIFLETIAKDAHMVLDEAHNFVGDSNTSQTIGNALLLSASSTFSSATFARDIKNLSVYSSVFSWLKNIDFEEYTPSQKRILAEESNRIATERGLILRRENDMSNMKLHISENEKNSDINELYCDKLAPILSSMAKLSRKVDFFIMEKNELNKNLLESLTTSEEKRQAREVWATANFGSRLNSIVGQFLVALKVSHCVELAVESLIMGEKPVIVIETTMESLMRELFKESEDKDVINQINEDNQLSLDLETESLVDIDILKPPSFQDALNIMADRLLRVSVRKGVEYEKQQIILDDIEFIAMQNNIKELVKDFPILSLSPIDDIREQIEKRGQDLFANNSIKKPWVCNEISARTLRVINGEYHPMKNLDRNEIVSKFVNGFIDTLIITRAGSTGLSIHDSEKFLNHAKRHMMELRAPSNVIERVQTWGRVFRRGQITEPRFTTLSTGLPFENYNLAVQNRKIEELCAAVTGSGKNITSTNIPDPIDSIGNEVAYEFLIEKQSLCDQMGISLNVDKEEADKELYFVGKLLRRLPLLNRDMQQKVFTSFMELYQDRLKNTSAHHFGRDLEGTWNIKKRVVFEAGDGSEDPIFGKDLYLTNIGTSRISKPLSTKDIISHVLASRDKQKEINLMDYIDAIERRKPEILKASLPKRFKTIAQALRHNEDNSVKKTNNKIENIIHILSSFVPGCGAIMPNDEDEMDLGILVDIRVPDKENAILAREYEILYAIPGDEYLKTISLEAIIRNNRILIQDIETGRQVVKRFDSAPKGLINIERQILDGNIFGAVLASKRFGFGNKTSYLDDDKNINNGILIPRSMEKRLLGQPTKTNIVSIASEIIKKKGKIQTNVIKPIEGVEIRNDSKNGFIVTIPPQKKISRLYEKELANICGSFNDDWRGRDSLSVPMNKLENVLELLVEKNQIFYTDSKYRRFIVDRTKEFLINKNDKFIVK